MTKRTASAAIDKAAGGRSDEFARDADERRRQFLIIPMPAGADERLRFEPLGREHRRSPERSAARSGGLPIHFGPSSRFGLELATILSGRRRAEAPGREPMRWWNVGVFAADTLAGLGTLQATIHDDWAEIAYVFGSKHWGQGYAQEAMRWFHERLREDGTAGTLWATVALANERSIRLLTRLGYAPIADGWPELGSYGQGDFVFCRSCR